MLNNWLPGEKVGFAARVTTNSTFFSTFAVDETQKLYVLASGQFYLYCRVYALDLDINWEECLVLIQVSDRQSPSSSLFQGASL